MADATKDREPDGLAVPKHTPPPDIVHARAEDGFNEETIQREVRLKRSVTPATADLALWVAIRNTTDGLGFRVYEKFVDRIMCGDLQDLEALDSGQTPPRRRDQLKLPFPGVDAYTLLKVSTEVFLMANCGVQIDTRNFDSQAENDAAVDYLKVDSAKEGRRGHRSMSQATVDGLWKDYVKIVNGGEGLTLPYLSLIRAKLKDVPIKPKQQKEAENCFGILEDKLRKPCFMELIWSYWHEEGMLVQTLNAISHRFQNKRGPMARDPLANLEIDPLRPVNNFLWGYIQDDAHRLTIARRVYEYDHHYGVALYGKAVPAIRPADSRSKFIEAFHNLLHLCANFYAQDDDTTVVADGFPVLNGLKETHILLSEGAHNQFGDLPSTARQEMLIEQWILARPELREFLGGRVMVANKETWMDRVDAMKKLQGWTDTPVTHFRDLGVYGEQVLLSIRFGAWTDEHEPESGANWARYWRPEIQSYIYAYRAVTGADLTSEPVDAAPPSVHLRHRLAAQGAKG